MELADDGVACHFQAVNENAASERVAFNRLIRLANTVDQSARLAGRTSDLGTAIPYQAVDQPRADRVNPLDAAHINGLDAAVQGPQLRLELADMCDRPAPAKRKRAAAIGECCPRHAAVVPQARRLGKPQTSTCSIS